VKTSARHTSPRRPRGTGSVYRRSDGYWIGEATIAGKRRRVTAKTEELAGLRLDELLKRSGEMPTADWDGKTVGSWLRYWLRQSVVRPVTRFGYTSITENHLIPTLGHVRLTELKPSHVRGLLSSLERKGLSVNTRRNVRNCLSAALEFAREDDLIAVNPARVKIADNKGGYRSNVVASRSRIETILEAIRYHRYAAIYATLLYTGMRIGEALALEWSDIDWEFHRLTIRRTLTREPLTDDPRRSRKVFGPPKSGRPRVIPISPQLVNRYHTWNDAEVARLALPKRTHLKTGLLFPSQRDQRMPVDPSHVLHSFQATLARAGITGADGGPMRLHECRHLYATYQLGRGTEVATVARLLGHSTPTTTMRFYAGVTQDADIVAAEAVTFFEPSHQAIATQKAVAARRKRERDGTSWPTTPPKLTPQKGDKATIPSVVDAIH
jgi:integrase